MLLGNFFTIINKEITDNSATLLISINAAHPIFEGHFPGQPVVPGVCMIQMIKEIMESIEGKPLQLKKADQLKFLAIINPVENPLVNITFSIDHKEDNIVLNGRIYKDELNFLKFKSSFILI
jgi:3-hydroxyacyl-[acyl-carrier-protein] dehydratase